MRQDPGGKKALGVGDVMDQALFAHHASLDPTLKPEQRSAARAREQQLQLLLSAHLTNPNRQIGNDISRFFDALHGDRAQRENSVAEFARKPGTTGPAPSMQSNTLGPGVSSALTWTASTGVQPILHVSDQIDSTPTSGFFKVAPETRTYPALHGVQEGLRANQILDSANAVKDDEQGRPTINWVDLAGREHTEVMPNYKAWGSEALKSVTYSQAGVPTGKPSIMGHGETATQPGELGANAVVQSTLGRDTIVGSLLFKLGAFGKKGVDYDVPTLVGTMPLIPNITGNRDRDRAALMDPLYLRAIGEADGHGKFGLIVGQTLVDMGEFIGTIAATEGAASLVSKGARAGLETSAGARLAGGFAKSGMVRHFVGVASDIRKAIGVAGEGDLAATSMKGGKGLATISGLNYGTTRQALQQIYYSTVSSAWKRQSVGEGFEQGVDAAILGHVFGRLAGAMRGLTAYGINIAFPRAKINAANFVRWASGEPVQDIGTSWHPFSPTRAADIAARKATSESARAARRLALDPAELATAVKKKVGYLPTTTSALRDAMKQVVDRDVHIHQMIAHAELATVGYLMGAHIEAREEARAKGEDWSWMNPGAIAARVIEKAATGSKLGAAQAVAMGTVGAATGLISKSRGGFWAQDVQRADGSKVGLKLALDDIAEAVSLRHGVFGANDIAFVLEHGKLFEKAFDSALGQTPKGELSKTIGQLPDMVADSSNALNPGKTRSDPDFKLSAGEQLAVYLEHNSDKGTVKNLRAALAAQPDDVLLRLYTQLRYVPETLGDGETGGTRVHAGRVQDLIRDVINKRPPGGYGEESGYPIGPGSPRAPAPLVEPSAGEGSAGKIVDQIKPAELAADEPGAVTDKSKKYGLTIERRESPAPEGGWVYAVVSKAGKVFGTHETMEKAQRQVAHIETTKTRAKRGTAGSARAKLKAEDTAPQPASAPAAPPAPAAAPAETGAGVPRGTSPAAEPQATPAAAPKVLDAAALAKDPGLILNNEGKASVSGLQRMHTIGFTKAVALAKEIDALRATTAKETAGAAELAAAIQSEVNLGVAQLAHQREEQLLAPFKAMKQVPPEVQRVLDGDDRVPTREELDAAMADVASLHELQGAAALHPDGGGNAAWEKYVGPYGHVSYESLVEGMHRAYDAALEHQPAKISERARPDQDRAALVEALNEAIEAAQVSGNADSVRDLSNELERTLALQAQVESKQTATKLADLAQAEELAQTGHGVAALPPPAPIVAPAAVYDGSLFTASTPEESLFTHGVETWFGNANLRPGAANEASQKGVRGFLQQYIAKGGTSAEHTRARKVLEDGLVFGTYGDPRLLSFADAVLDRPEGTSAKRFNEMIDHVVRTRGDQVSEYLRQIKIVKDGKPKQLYSEITLKLVNQDGSINKRGAQVLSHYLQAAYGIPMTARDGGWGEVRRSVALAQAAEISTLEGARDVAKGLFLTKDPNAGAAAAHALMFSGKRQLEWVQKAKWQKGRAGRKGEDSSFIRTRDPVAMISETIQEAIGGSSSSENPKLVGATPEERTPTLRAKMIIADLSGHTTQIISKSISGAVKTEGRGAEAENPVQRMAAGADKRVQSTLPTNLEEYITAIQKDPFSVDVDKIPDRFHPLKTLIQTVASARNAEKAGEILRNTFHPDTGLPLLNADEGPGADGGPNVRSEIRMHQLANEDAQLHDWFTRSGPDGERNWQDAVAAVKSATHFTRGLGSTLFSDEPVGKTGHNRFEAWMDIVKQRAADPNAPLPDDLVALGREHGLIGENERTLGVNASDEMARDFMDKLSAGFDGQDAQSKKVADAFMDSTAYFFSFDPLASLFQWSQQRPQTPDPYSYGNTSRYAVGRQLDKFGPKLFESTLGKFALGGLRVPAKYMGLRSQGTMQGLAERTQNRAVKTALRMHEAAQRRVIDQLHQLLSNHLSKLDVQQGDLFTKIVDSGVWLTVKNETELAARFGNQSRALFGALQAYNDGVVDLGRHALLSGMISQKQFDSFVKEGKTRYIMRSRFELAKPSDPGNEYITRIGREHKRETMPDGDDAQRITDPAFLAMRQYSQEASRITVLRSFETLRKHGIPLDVAHSTIPPWERARFESLALAPGTATDPLTNRPAKERQFIVHRFLTAMQTDIAAGRIDSTPIKERLIADILGKGLAVTDFNAKDLHTLIETHASNRAGLGSMDYALQAIESAASVWRTNHTTLKFRYWLLNTVGSFTTNHFSGCASYGDAVAGLFGKGPYSHAGNALRDIGEYWASGRTWDLDALGEKGKRIRLAEKFIMKMGGSTMVSNLIEHGDMGNAFARAAEANPEVLTRMANGPHKDLVATIVAQSGGELLTRLKLERTAASLFGNEGGRAADKVRAIEMLNAANQRNELYFKLAAFFGLLKQYPHAEANGQHLSLLMDDAAAATGDYTEVNPYVKDFTSRMARARDTILRPSAPGASEGGLAMTRMLFGTPFLQYPQVITPAMGRSMMSVKGVLNTATGLALMAGVMETFAYLSDKDQDQTLEAAAGQPTMMPGVEWGDEEQRQWDLRNKGMVIAPQGPVDGTGRIWRAAQEVAKRQSDKFKKGIWFVYGGPNRGYRSSVIDMTNFMGGHPIEGLQRGIRVGEAISKGEFRVSSAYGWLAEHAIGLGMFADLMAEGEKGMTRGERLMTGVHDFTQDNVGDLNPSANFLSRTSLDFYGSVNNHGVPIKEEILGLTRPEGGQANVFKRAGASLLGAALPMREVTSQSLIDSSEPDTWQAIAQTILKHKKGTGEATTNPQAMQDATRASMRINDELQNLFRSAFEIAQRDNGSKGGVGRILQPMLALDNDTERYIEPATKMERTRLIPGKNPNSMSELGRMISRMEPGLQDYALASAQLQIDKIYSKNVTGQLAYLMDRRAIDGAIAQRLTKALMAPDGVDALMRLMHKELVADNSDKNLGTYWNLWRGLQVDVAQKGGPSEAQYPIFKQLSERFGSYSPSEPDRLVSPVEAVGGFRKAVDILPRESIQSLAPARR